MQDAQAAHLQKDLSDGLLCAVINNNTRCYNESTEFADHLDDALAPPYKVQPLISAFACALPTGPFCCSKGAAKGSDIHSAHSCRVRSCKALTVLQDPFN